MTTFMQSSSVALVLHVRRRMMRATIATSVIATNMRESACVSNQRPRASAVNDPLLGFIPGVPYNYLTGSRASDSADEPNDRPPERLREKADRERKRNDERRPLVTLLFFGYSSHNPLPLFASLSLH